MARTVVPRPLVVVVIASILIVNAVVFRGRLTAWVADISGPALAPVSASLMRARTLMLVAVGREDIAARQLALEDEVLRLQAQLANQEELKRDLEFYRSAAGIRERMGKDPIKAGIFAYPSAGGVKQVVINRGRAEWVVVGDVVMTSSGALVGAVSRIFEHHAVVNVIGDIGLEVTVRILGSDVTGLLRTTAEHGTIMDLVQKNETVTENSVVVTSGDDWYPPGLIVGTVRSVDNEAATLFQIVRVKPAIAGGAGGDVIVMRP